MSITDITKPLKCGSPQAREALREKLLVDRLVEQNLVDKKYKITDIGIKKIQDQISLSPEYQGLRETVGRHKKDPQLSRIFSTIIATVLTWLGLTQSSHAETMPLVSTQSPASVMPIMPSVASTTKAISSSTTATTSILFTKTVLVPMLAVLLVTGGVYIVAPKIFVPNETMDFDGIDTRSSLQLSSMQNSTEISSSFDTDYSDSSSPNSSSESALKTAHSIQTDQTEQSAEIPIDAESLIESITSSPSDGGGSSGITSTPSNTDTNSPENTPEPPNSQPNFEQPTSDIFIDQFQVLGMAFDSRGNMYATDLITHQVHKFSPTGNLVMSIGNNVVTPVSFEFSKHFDMMPQISSLFLPYAHAVEIPYCHIISKAGCIDSDGIGPLEVGDGQFFNPSGIAINSEDYIFVVDRGNNRIQVFNSEGEFIDKFGEFGKSEGQFDKPFGIDIDKNDNLYVTDSENNRVQKFDSEGNFIRGFGTSGSNPGQFQDPWEIAINSEGQVYVVDRQNHRIQVFNSEGMFIKEFGKPGFHDDAQFHHPRGITIDGNDNIYIIDSYNGQIQVFDSTGKFLVKIDDAGSENTPLKISGGITTDGNDNIYISDIDSPGIQKISFEDAVVSFSKKFDEIKCDTDSMINNPITVPPEIALALPTSELLSRANDLAESEQFDESLFFYYIAAQIQSANPHAWNGIGYSQTFVCDNNSPSDAYHNTLSLDENNTNALNGLGFFYANQATLQSQSNAPRDLIESTTSLAIASYEKVPGYQTNVNALNGLATVHVILEQYDKAIEKFVLSFGLDSQRVPTLNGLADAHLKSGNLVMAESFYENALDVDANNFDALSGLLSIYLQQDDKKKVNETLVKLEQFQEQVIASLIAEGQWLLERGSTEEAKQFFEKVLELDPGNEIVLRLLNSFR